MEYIDFASKISFYEFLQNEFKKPHFNTDKYKDEINLLRNKLNIVLVNSHSNFKRI